MTIQVDLVLPGLFNLPAVDLNNINFSDDFPALNTLLRYSHKQTNNCHDIDAVLSDCLGFDQATKIPFASAFAKDKNDDQTGNDVVFRGAHLKPDLRNAFVMPVDDTDDYQDDIFLLINDLSDLFKQDCDISDLGKGYWLMRSNACQPPLHYPHYLSIVGRKVDQYIEQSRSALPWYQLINEMQMFLHAHEVNQKRQSNGHLPINSLWCWGGGSFLPPQRQRQIWYCDDHLMQAYGRRSGILYQPVKNVALADFYQETLIVDFSIMQVLKSTVDQDPGSILAEIEMQIFEPLLKAVKKRQVDLRLRAGYDFDLLLTRRSLLKFWRRKTSPGDWLDCNA